MVNPVDIGLRIAQALDGIGIKMGSYIGKSSNVKKAMFGGKSTMFKPNAIQALRGEGKNFDDALKLIEEEAQFIVNATDAEKMAFLNNLNDYKDLGGPLKKDVVARKEFEEGIGSLQDDIKSLQSTAKTMKDDAEKGLKSAEEDLKTFLETGGNPLKKKEEKYLGGSMHEEGQLRTAIRTFLKNEFKNGRIKLDETDKFRVMEYSPMMEDDPIKVFKKIYGDEAYKRAGTFPGAFEIGESFNHYESIFRSKMGEDILKVKDKKYVGDGTLTLTKQEEVFEPKPDVNDDDVPFAKGGRAGFASGGGLKKIVQEIIEYITTKFTPMDAMKEINKVVGKTGKYKNLKLTDDDINDIVEGSNDFIFQRDPDNLFVEGSIKERTKYFDDADEAGTFFPKTSKDSSIDEMSVEDSLTTLEGLGATKMAERFKLKQRYPGISEDLLTNIIEDTDPVHKASVLAKMDQAMKLIVGEGKGTDEAIDILKSEPKTKMATGGRAGYYGGGQAMVEPDLSDIGHGSDALMARTRITAPGSQATTSTGLNYLLGEDNDNIRVPFNEGLLAKPSDSMMVDTTTSSPDFYNTDKFKEDSMTLLKGMYGTGKDSNKFLYNEMIKKGNELRKQGVDRETVIEIIRNNKDKIDMILKQQTTFPKSLKGLANGGRIGFAGGGADMGTVDAKDSQGNVTRAATAKSVNVSPSGQVTTSRTEGPDEPDYSAVGPDSVYAENVVNQMQEPSFNVKAINAIDKANDLNKFYNFATTFNPLDLYKSSPYAFAATGILSLAEKRRLNKLRKEQENSLQPLAEGGVAGLRQGYAGGNIVDKGRRGFLKFLGGTAAGVVALKAGLVKMLGKESGAISKKAIDEVIIDGGSGAPAWLQPLVNKALRDGKDISKNAIVDGQVVKSLDTPTGKVDVYYNTRTGEVDVDYIGGNTALGESVQMRYTPGIADEGTKGVKPADEFEATEAIPEYQGGNPLDGPSLEVGENITSDVKGLYSDTSELAELGGQKTLTKDIVETVKKKKILKQMEEDPSEFITNEVGIYDPT